MEINCYDDFAKKAQKCRAVYSRKNFQMTEKLPNGNKLLLRLHKKSPKMRPLISRKNSQMAGKYQMGINCSTTLQKVSESKK